MKPKKVKAKIKVRRITKPYRFYLEYCLINGNPPEYRDQDNDYGN